MQEVKNTVPAENQMVNASELSFLGEASAPLRVLVLGNSITRHGPNADIGWNRDWGMAASAPEKDYVHLLYTKLTEAGYDVYMRVRHSSYWEQHFREADCLSHYASERDFGADVLVYRLGENVESKDIPYYKSAVKELLTYLNIKPGRTILTSRFWGREDMDEPLRQIARERGDIFVSTACTDDSMMALGQFAHQGVSVHPGDKGMEMIASNIFSVFPKV